jgi:hypothetical protein
MLHRIYVTLDVERKCFVQINLNIYSLANARLLCKVPIKIKETMSRSLYCTFYVQSSCA